jgi:hypothetical protein
MVQNASEASVRARRLTKAQLLAETKMDELVAGVLPLANGGGAIEGEIEGWTYDVSVSPESWSSVTDSSGANVDGLNSAVVTVRFSSAAFEPIEYTLARMILAPSLRLPSQGGQ